MCEARVPFGVGLAELLVPGKCNGRGARLEEETLFPGHASAFYSCVCKGVRGRASFGLRLGHVLEALWSTLQISVHELPIRLL